MPRPVTKKELTEAANANYEKLFAFIETMTEKELDTPFDFSSLNKKEAHWARDKNLRDVLAHLYEWHRLLLEWTEANLKGEERPFIPKPYSWKTYGDMNIEFWNKHQSTELNAVTEMLKGSHSDVMALLDSFSDEELFTKGVYKWIGGSTLGSYFISVTASHYDWALKKLRTHRKLLSAKEGA
ncbi:MAG: ClbS/DfsB family four-helix bundle protein [Oscillospiraceae bacterium]|nr:ClbS/DfsB family four-helix bundle protein [Oscillospiraceae bacterium]